MVDKIMNIAELKKAVENLRTAFMLRPYEKLLKNYIFRDDILKLINEFEVNVRKRLSGKEVQSRDWLIRETIEEELRRILGGEGERR